MACLKIRQAEFLREFGEDRRRASKNGAEIHTGAGQSCGPVVDIARTSTLSD